jgi:methylated-DNA-[protein]-cysteine S-methyltransferase
MIAYFDTFKTAFGPFSVAVDDTGAVVGTAFGGRSALEQRVPEYRLTSDKIRTRAARQQIVAYASGQRRDFDVPLAPHGTDFQKSVWNALCQIPLGKTLSYGALAVQLGRPKASRAVGRANATNPICLIVPCHRVIGADGSLTGFAFGEAIKRRLLEHEGALSATSRAA